MPTPPNKRMQRNRVTRGALMQVVRRHLCRGVEACSVTYARIRSRRQLSVSSPWTAPSSLGRQVYAVVLDMKTTEIKDRMRYHYVLASKASLVDPLRKADGISTVPSAAKNHAVTEQTILLITAARYFTCMPSNR